uniref:Electromagnetic perceptive protein n=1 Tax=Kryptopterus bicirrhis TaxID=310914 RepID=A0A385NIE2_9TELE
MKCVLLGFAAVIGFFAIAESLTCNTCSVSLIGICLNPATATCSTNTSVCTTGRASFTGVLGFLGFNSQGCTEGAQCNGTVSGSILGASYTVTQTCCSTNNCNPVTSGASYVQISVSAALSAALLACVWGQSVY